MDDSHRSPAGAKRSRRVDIRGRRIGVTAEAYERVAASRGGDGVANALLARSNLRWDMIYRNLDTVAPITFPALAPVPALARALDRLGADRSRIPADMMGEWVDHLRWGVDSALQATRFLLVGNVVGAASIVRQQLERWTMNLAHTLGLTKEAAEDDETFYRRVWKQYDRNPIDAGTAYREISELLHGRGPLASALQWTQFELMRRPVPADAEDAVARVALTISLFLRQLRGCVTSFARDEGRISIVEMVERWPETVPFQGTYEYLGPSLWPLTYPKLGHPALRNFPELGQRLLKTVAEAQAAGATADSLRLAVLHQYVDHRLRALQGVHASLQQEQTVLDHVDESSLDGQEIYTTFLAEMSTLVSQWGVRPEVASSLLTAADAVRSCFYLWLEDDDRSMMCVRTLWESVARLCAWRLKPERAMRLTQRGRRASLRDWFDAAGWKRLSLLMRALGEMSHAKVGSHWWGARQSLAELHAPDLSSDDHPLMRARGQTLKRAQYLLGVELVELLKTISPTISVAYNTLITEGYEPATDLDEWLRHAWDKRDFDFGPATLAHPDEARNAT